VIRRFSRRAFVSSLAAVAASPAFVFKPQSTCAQQPTSPRRIGVLLVAFALEDKEPQAFRQGLLDAEYVEGRDVVIEWRSASGDYARVPALAADLDQRKVDVIVADSTSAARAAKRATSTIPIVMAIVADPVGSGLVTNFAHPGGNVTGLLQMMPELGAKRLQLLKEAIPRLTRVADLWNPDTPFHPKAIEALKAVAPSLSIELSFVGVRTPPCAAPRQHSSLARPLTLDDPSVIVISSTEKPTQPCDDAHAPSQFIDPCTPASASYGPLRYKFQNTAP
jgi:putative ABC transport system substrate-binding protein